MVRMGTDFNQALFAPLVLIICSPTLGFTGGEAGNGVDGLAGRLPAEAFAGGSAGGPIRVASLCGRFGTGVGGTLNTGGSGRSDDALPFGGCSPTLTAAHSSIAA